MWSHRELAQRKLINSFPQQQKAKFSLSYAWCSCRFCLIPVVLESFPLCDRKVPFISVGGRNHIDHYMMSGMDT